MNIRNQFKYHFTYETLCLVNGKKYIGKHSTNDINDGYLGSGSLLKKAILKYGKENFYRRIVSFYDTLDECMNAERELVNENVVNDDSYYNLKEGGEGGVYHEDVKRKISERAKGRKIKPEHVEKAKATRIKNGGWARGEDHPMYGKTHTPEAIEKFTQTITEKYKSGEMITWNKGKSLKDLYSDEERKKYGRDTSGEKNPAAGSVWFGNYELGVKCYVHANNADLFDMLKKSGWVLKPKNFNSLKSVTKEIYKYV